MYPLQNSKTVFFLLMLHFSIFVKKYPPIYIATITHPKHVPIRLLNCSPIIGIILQFDIINTKTHF